MYLWSQVKEYMDQHREVNGWIPVVKQYITDMNGELIPDKKLVFAVETQIFRTNTAPQRSLSVMVSTYVFL